MSCALKPTMPTSCSSDLYVACPTIINVQDWLMVHHTTVSGECGQQYHIFAVTEYPIFGLSKKEYVSANIAIPLGPLSVELTTEVDVRYGVGPRRSDQVAVGVKYPLLPSVNAGTFKGDLRDGRGITTSVGVPEVYGSIRIWIKDDPVVLQPWLWVEFDLCVFGVEYKGSFAVFPVSLGFSSSSDKLLTTVRAKKAALATTELEAPASEAVEEIEAPGEVEDETDDTFNDNSNVATPSAAAAGAA